eukprot:Lithocolla_globosa_v1_NODE_3602_length_1625_cov_25.538217.p1 type:complete len:347 gc:universal NODE_3602_length_1625_cov_25.538217:419-1459(+)
MEELYGYLAVVGAVVFFGSFAVPMRSLKSYAIPPMVFQVYFSGSVSLTTLLVLTYNPFVWSWWGVAGGALWTVIQPFAFMAVNWVGISVGQSTWSGITILVSFLWGLLFFNEEITSLPLCLTGIAILAFGIAMISVSTTTYPNQWASRLFGWKKYQEVAMNEGQDDQYIEQRKDDVEQTSLRDRVLGTGCTIIVGLLNGSQMVPFSLFVEQQKELNGDAAEGLELAYLAGFSIGVAMATPPLFFLWSVSQYMNGQSVDMQWRLVAWRGGLQGVIWSIANWCATYATLYLGNTVGFPLTQCAVLVAALWGILYFREMDLPGMIIFVPSALALLGGAALLSVYGSDGS